MSSRKRRNILVLIAIVGVALWILWSEKFFITSRMFVGRWGHDQHWIRTPFPPQKVELPQAVTPNGVPLSLTMIAGSYRMSGSHAGCGLDIDPDGSCRFGEGRSLWSGHSECLARIVDGRIEFEALSLWGHPTGEVCVCIPVWWKGIIFLLGPSGNVDYGGIGEFCDSINRGFDPDGSTQNWSVRFFMNAPFDTTSKSSSGPTLLPKAFDEFLLHAPVEGSVTAAQLQTGWIDRGRKSGVFVGMTFTYPVGERSRTLRVISVNEDSCEVGTDWFELAGIPPVGTRVKCEVSPVK